VSGGHRAGFETQRAEATARLTVEGELPTRLRGRYLADGPDQFEVGGDPLGHLHRAPADGDCYALGVEYGPETVVTLLRRPADGGEPTAPTRCRFAEPPLPVLGAETLTERARAPLPHRLPYGFHGQFYGPHSPRAERELSPRAGVVAGETQKPCGPYTRVWQKKTHESRT
jgi:hypothetical protein